MVSFRVFMGYNPQESLENTTNAMGTLLGVHPIVPWQLMLTDLSTKDLLKLPGSEMRIEAPTHEEEASRDQPWKHTRENSRIFFAAVSASGWTSRIGGTCIDWEKQLCCSSLRPQFMPYRTKAYSCCRLGSRWFSCFRLQGCWSEHIHYPWSSSWFHWTCPAPMWAQWSCSDQHAERLAESLGVVLQLQWHASCMYRNKIHLWRDMLFDCKSSTLAGRAQLPSVDDPTQSTHWVPCLRMEM